MSLLAFLLLCCCVQESQAQWRVKWLTVGDLHSNFFSGGSEPENFPPAEDFQWPGIRPDAFYNHWKGLWISAKNVKAADGTEYPVRISHIGPRFPGIGEFFDIQHDLVGQFEAPQTFVDGLETFDKPVQLDRVDEALRADQMIDNVANSSVGITTHRQIRAFSNEFHDDYYIVEYTFTNTGNQDADPEIEVEQPLEDVYFTFFRRQKINAPMGSWTNSAGGNAWGQFTMNDAVGDGIQDYGVDFRAMFSWMGHTPSQTNYSTIGSPLWFPPGESWYYSVSTDTVGRLGGAAMVGTVIIHADAHAHPEGEAAPDDPTQPAVMTYLDSDDAELTGRNDHSNVSQMQFEREWIENGAPYRNYDGITWSGERTTPTHAYTVHPADGEVDFVEHFASQQADPSHGRAGGWGYVYSFGPYDMAPGDQVKIVVAEGIAGISDELALQLGMWYKRNGADDTAEFSWNPATSQECDPGSAGCITMTKNEWALTARDSLFQLFDRAIAAYNAGYAVPRPPMPPRTFNVTSGTDRIVVEWEPYPGAPSFAGWELYRAQNAYHGIPTRERAGGPLIGHYELVGEFGPNETRFEDTDVQRGVSYFYYLVAVGNPNADGTANTPTGVPLRSSRYFAQTYDPAVLKRPPGETLADVRIVPNPYIIAADATLRWPDQQDKIGFLDVPANATIKIYTELGELVETIEHTDGSGDEYWNLTTSSNQVVVSGIYIAVITDNDTGDQVIRKFVIIR